MGDLGRDANYADFGSANCMIGLDGCQPDQPFYQPSTMLRYDQRWEGESCYGTSGVCAPGLYCNRGYTCARLPWDPPSTNTYPFYLYSPVRGKQEAGPPNTYNVVPLPSMYRK